MYSSRTQSLISVIEELLHSRAAEEMLDLDGLSNSLDNNTLDQLDPVAVRLFPHFLADEQSGP